MYKGTCRSKALLHIFSTVKPVRLEHISDKPVKTLDRAIGFGRSGFGQAVFNAPCLAQLIKLVFTRGLTGTRGKEAVRELFAVVGQQFLNVQGARLVQGVEESFGGGQLRASNPAHGCLNDGVARARVGEHTVGGVSGR